MRILCLGDVVGAAGVDAVCARLPSLKRALGADAVIANGENASMGRGNGLTPDDVDALLTAGVDVITGGNHSFRQKCLYPLLDCSPALVRPANYYGANPGRGYTVLPVNGRNMLVVNVSGRVNMDVCADPFKTLSDIFAREAGSYDFAVVDLHAEATSEKIAVAYDCKDRAAVVFGTHTHVQTADEQILEGGCGYITDLGMCGPSRSALGVKVEVIIEKLKTGMPCKFELSENPAELQGALFTLDDHTLRCVSVERVRA